MVAVRFSKFHTMIVVALFMVEYSMSFTTPVNKGAVPAKILGISVVNTRRHVVTLLAAESSNKDDGVVELAVEDEEKEQAAASGDKGQTVAPFLSQGEIAPESLEMDWSDPKQTRVMIYIILSLLPILFLIPLMLGSRELIPLEVLPPVDM